MEVLSLRSPRRRLGKAGPEIEAAATRARRQRRRFPAADMGLPGTLFAPVRRTQFRPSSNDNRSKILIAHQGEVRAIHNGTGLIASAAIRTVAG